MRGAHFHSETWIKDLSILSQALWPLSYPTILSIATPDYRIPQHNRKNMGSNPSHSRLPLHEILAIILAKTKHNNEVEH